jgi:hypothetical protein
MAAKPRVFISTDIGGGDHDDDQSLVHALLYADQMNIVGLAQTVAANTPGGSKNDILQVIDQYAKDYDNLKTYGGYPTADQLRSITYQGATTAAPSAGWSKATAGSNAIVAAARAASPSDPLYVLTWGGETDIAQALHDAPDIAGNIRLLSIGKQDANATRYLESGWKEKVWWIQDTSTFRGMYAESGSNSPYGGSWVANNAKGHGALGDYFDTMSHGLWDEKSGSANGYGIKMGDTPSLFYVLDVIRNGRSDPTQEGWGGEFVKKGANYWTDDGNAALKIGSWAGAKTVAEDRTAFLADFAARLDRADHPASGATAPAPVAGSQQISIGSNEVEGLKLSGFAVEAYGEASGGQWVRTNGSGSASGTFAGSDGTYKLDVDYRDENDGRSPMSISVNGKVVKSWTATIDDEHNHSQSVEVFLRAGDVIALNGTANGGEYARLDALHVTAKSGSTPAPTPTPTVPAVRGAIGTGVTEAENLKLAGLFVAEDNVLGSAGKVIKTQGGGVATGSFTGASGSYALGVAYLDESDGRSPISLEINGHQVASWRADANDDAVHMRATTVTLNQGDIISVKGALDGGEFARIDYLAIAQHQNDLALLGVSTLHNDLIG